MNAAASQALRDQLLAGYAHRLRTDPALLDDALRHLDARSLIYCCPTDALLNNIARLWIADVLAQAVREREES